MRGRDRAASTDGQPHSTSQSPAPGPGLLPPPAQASCPQPRPPASFTFHTTSEGLADHSCVILLLCWPLIHVDSGSGRASIQDDSILKGKGRVCSRLGPSGRSSHCGLLGCHFYLFFIHFTHVDYYFGHINSQSLSNPSLS